MNKQELYNACQGVISKLAINEYSGSWVIMGKWGMIEHMDDYWDIWCTGVHRGEVLGTKRVNILSEKLKSCITDIDTVFNNEWTGVCRDTSLIPFIAVCIGARKRKRYSPEDIAKRVARLQKAQAERRS